MEFIYILLNTYYKINTVSEGYGIIKKNIPINKIWYNEKNQQFKVKTFTSYIT